MTEIWDDNFYMAKRRPPYIETKAGWGYDGDTVFFFYGITPKGNLSHYWASYQIAAEFPKEEKLRRLKMYAEVFRPRLRKGYTWSEPRLYAGKL